ncbi:MAG: hypothetical protein ACOX0F_04950 [Syntrophomonadaceae bacterium]|jgi:hypothetical protein
MNISSRTKMIIISLLLLVISGCANPNIPQDKVQEEPQATLEQEKQSFTPKPVVTEEADKMEVMASDKIPGWKKLKARVSLSELIEHGSQPIDDNKKVGFSIHFPGSWTMSSSVFCDENNKKVAEIPPTVLLKSGQEAVFLDYKPATDNGEELVSKEAIQINSCKGSKIITKIPTESGSWYPHIYRLTDKTHGFTIVLYSKVINKEDQALFDKIINTFNFEQ